MFVQQLPIPLIKESDQQQFIELVDDILAIKEGNKDSNNIEKLIDQLVYKLYNLTPTEIEYIEKQY